MLALLTWHGLYRRAQCWLKVQADPTAPKVNHRGEFPATFRAEHKTAPLSTPWLAGVLRSRATASAAA
jgi:hypothetical protein